MGKKVTLKQIAEMAEVSLTSVHRVLNGKGGCSKEVEEKILQIAKEQGYYINTVAPLRNKGPIHIALVFPPQVKGSHLFLNRILEGYLRFRDEVSQFNVVFQEFYVEQRNMKESDNGMCRILKQIYQEKPFHYDGVIIYGLMILREAEGWINRLVGSGTKVVVLERTPKSLDDICSVGVNDILAGNLAGEMLSKCIHSQGTVVVFEQKILEGEDINGTTCVACLKEYLPNIKVEQIEMGLEYDQCESMIKILQHIPDLVGVYATCARHTYSLLKALERSDIRLQAVIGSELFEESYEALQQRRLDAVIDKRPELIGYDALRLIFANLVKNEELPISHKVTPRIILRANSEKCYLTKEEENEYVKNNDYE